MSFTRADLDAMRALIRVQSGLPEPPARPARATDPEAVRAPVAQVALEQAALERAPLERAATEKVAPLPPEPSAAQLPPVVGAATPGDAGPERAPALPPSVPEPWPVPAAAGEPWRPDAVVHRLVELLIEMRRLSAPADADPPAARAA
jgi:hypothetical protein